MYSSTILQITNLHPSLSPPTAFCPAADSDSEIAPLLLLSFRWPPFDFIFSHGKHLPPDRGRRAGDLLSRLGREQWTDKDAQHRDGDTEQQRGSWLKKGPCACIHDCIWVWPRARRACFATGAKAPPGSGHAPAPFLYLSPRPPVEGRSQPASASGEGRPL